MSHLSQLQTSLEKSPGDWDLRAEIVEALVLQGDLDAARKLVRGSPDAPVPYHIQKRFWNALAPSAGITVERVPGGKPILKAKARVVRPETGGRRFRTSPTRRRALNLRSAASKPRRLAIEPPPSPAEPVSLRLVPLEPGDLLPRSSPRSRRSLVSAMAAALFVHLFLAMGLSMVVLRNYVRLPPSITVSIAPAEKIPEVDLKKPALLREVAVPNPAAPSHAGASLVLPQTASAVSLPAFDKVEGDATMPDVGLGVSRGLSFEPEGAETAINFFGITGSGQCMIFLIEASPHMLLDEKGGMYAYNKVKEEIAALLQTLNRGTAFNIILFDDKRLRLFQSRPVRALPSMVQRAIAWLDPVNRDYDNLGLGAKDGGDAIRSGAKPIIAADIAHYAKALQAALEQDASTVFCITSGWKTLTRSLSPEDQAKLDKALAKREKELEGKELPPPQFDPKEVEKWRQAQQKARDWLDRENQARAAKGMPPKVVIDFGALVRKLSPGVSPPRPIDEAELPPLDAGVEPPPPYSPDEVEDHIRNVVQANFGKEKPKHPSINLVLFLGEEEAARDLERTGPYEKHFLDLTRQNKGKLQILRGLAALEDVTSTR